MARPIRLLRVSDPAERFYALIEAAAELGVRVGWLEVGTAVSTPLDEVASHGATRAVALDARGSVAVKRINGVPVLRDVLREHFLGSSAVLARIVDDVPTSIAEQLAEAAALHCRDEGFVLSRGSERQALSRDELIRALGRPSHWAWRE